MKNCFRSYICKKDKKDEGDYIEELYTIDIWKEKEGEERKRTWVIILRRYEHFKIVVVEFYKKENSKANGIKRYARNRPNDYVEPLMTMFLLKKCLELCTTGAYSTYSYAFYAIDDVWIEKREDMNKRMSVYRGMIERMNKQSGYNFEAIGDLNDSFYIGFNKQYGSKEKAEAFITYYKPKLQRDIKELYGEQISQKI